MKIPNLNLFIKVLMNDQINTFIILYPVYYILSLRGLPNFVHPTGEVNLFASGCCHLKIKQKIYNHI